MRIFTFDQRTIQAEARNWRARSSSSSATSARCVAVPCRRLNSASTTWRTHPLTVTPSASASRLMASTELGGNRIGIDPPRAFGRGGRTAGPGASCSHRNMLGGELPPVGTL
jgi:hypothetical protein